MISLLRLLMSLLFIFPLIANSSWKENDDENFETIVQRLSQPKTPTNSSQDNDPFANLRIHGGVGFSQSITQFTDTSGEFRYFSQKGFQAAVGVDLFSPNWIAEGAIVSFADSKMDSSIASLREFDLRLYYHSPSGPFWTYIIGSGIAARYLTMTDLANGISTEIATPSTIFFAGLMARLNSNISLTTEVATRNALIDDTQDKSALNMTFRIDTHF